MSCSAARPRLGAEGGPGRGGRGSLARGSLGGADLRAALDADAGLVRGRGGGAGRDAAGAARGGDAAHARRVGRRHGPGDVALRARDRDPLGLGRAGRRAGHLGRGAGRERAHPDVPPLPGAGRPADAARALRRSRGTEARLRRRRQQLRSLARDPRPHRRRRGRRRQPRGLPDRAGAGGADRGPRPPRRARTRSTPTSGSA